MISIAPSASTSAIEDFEAVAPASIRTRRAPRFDLACQFRKSFQILLRPRMDAIENLRGIPIYY
jgi:hypothetical protein